MPVVIFGDCRGTAVLYLETRGRVITLKVKVVAAIVWTAEVVTYKLLSDTPREKKVEAL